jgi:predicted glycosyltransferase
MVDRLDSARLLIYSHDTFGLGHLRRCRTIAHWLVEQYKGLSVLILSGSPIIGSFDFRARVDFVKIPGIIKLYNGEYTPLGRHLDLKETLSIRASIIRHTAEAFNPDLFLVDKEPLGLKGEVRDTLSMLKANGTSLVIGLRDVMDEPSVLRAEWDKRSVMPVLEKIYDEIWVYGLPQVHDPLSELDVPQAVRDKMIFTGYLPRTAPSWPSLSPAVEMEEPYLLVTAGGGGDGGAMMDWVLSAYEIEPDLPWSAVLVLGPFMPSAEQEELQERTARLDNVQAITFDSHLELLMEKCAGMVAMGGYNTFCEILSFDKPAVIVPRTQPRREQLIRAERAQDLGLARRLSGDGERDPAVMAEALRALPDQPRPSTVVMPGLLDGLNTVSGLLQRHVERRRGTAPITLRERASS